MVRKEEAEIQLDRKMANAQTRNLVFDFTLTYKQNSRILPENGVCHVTPADSLPCVYLLFLLSWSHFWILWKISWNLCSGVRKPLNWHAAWGHWHPGVVTWEWPGWCGMSQILLPFLCASYEVYAMLPVGAFSFIDSDCSPSLLCWPFRSRMLKRGWVLQVIWDIHVSLPLSLPDSPLVPPGHHLPPDAPPLLPPCIPPSSAASNSGHYQREERRAGLCKYAWMEVSVASCPAELSDLWPGDLRGSWDHIRAPATAGGWCGGALHDHGAW